MIVVGMFWNVHSIGKVVLKNKFNFTSAVLRSERYSCFCDQIDSVAMGCPLAPVLANLFTDHHEKRWLENCNSGIEFY